MTRGWIIFSSLVLGVVFRLWKYNKADTVGFILSDRTLDVHSWVYFFMEHIIAIALAMCIIIRDDTPKAFFYLFIGILVLDLAHYLLFFRDEGFGWNLTKCALFGLPLLYVELNRLWAHLHK